MATASKTRNRKATSSTPERVARLRDIAERDALAARDAAWAWFERLGKLAANDREAGAEQLEELFACGQPSRGIDGPTDGILVTTLIHPIPDFLMRQMAASLMPWAGKRFDAKQSRGDNLLFNAARWPIKLIWPLYSTGDGDGMRLAFDFETRVESGGVEPSVDVLVIDYADIKRNPRLVVRSIRDELVEIVDGAHLGRILWRQGEDRYANIGYFALRTPAS